jgi:RNA polymerase sigma factor for flagellar operon FliA
VVTRGERVSTAPEGPPVTQATATRTSATATAQPILSAAEIDVLVREHLPLVGHLVRELLGRIPGHVHRDDLTSAGMTALVLAARSYQPDRGTPFGRFAAARIRGALLDELRGLDWASRSVRTRARKLDTTTAELTTALGRTPTPAEIAGAMGISIEEINAVEDDVARAVVLSLHGFTTGTADDLVTDTTPGPEAVLIHRERLGYLTDAITALPDRLRAVIQGYYLDERPMAQIATELGVTESRISQLRAEALTLLRDGLNTHLDPDQAPTTGTGCAARRRHSYYATISANRTLNSRLSHTSTLGLPGTHVA